MKSGNSCAYTRYMPMDGFLQLSIWNLRWTSLIVTMKTGMAKGIPAGLPALRSLSLRAFSLSLTFGMRYGQRDHTAKHGRKKRFALTYSTTKVLSLIQI